MSRRTFMHYVQGDRAGDTVEIDEWDHAEFATVRVTGRAPDGVSARTANTQVSKALLGLLIDLAIEAYGRMGGEDGMEHKWKP